MSTISALKGTRDAAQADLVDAVKHEIKRVLNEILSLDNAPENIVFGVSTTPFNDENSGEGVFGPLVDQDESKFEEGYYHDLFYGYGNTVDPRVKPLENLLDNEAGFELVAAAFGMDCGYDRGSTNFFVASLKPDGGLSLVSHDQDY